MQRRRILIGILGILISGSIYAGLKEGESQLKAYSWFRYTYEQENAVTNMSEFAVKRGYLRWEHQFTNRIKSRFTVDFFTDDDYPDGAGIKIKDAYVDFNYLIPDGKIRIGLQANYFGHVYDWKGYTIERSFPDKENVVASRDFGISIGGNIIKDYGEWNLEITNGEGYKMTGGNINTELAYLGNIRFTPIPCLKLGLSSRYENRGEGAYEKRFSNSCIIDFFYGPVTIWNEFLYCNTTIAGNIITSLGYMVMPILKDILPNLDFVARYDYWDPDTEGKNDSHKRYIAGFNYHFIKGTMGNVMLQVNFERLEGEEVSLEPVNQVMVQLRWEFATDAL